MTAMLLVHRKAYTRKSYTRKDGTRVKETRVPASSFKVKDRGEPGRTPESKKWATFVTETGWEKTQKTATRRKNVFAATDKRQSKHDQYVQAGRMMNQLANVTTDKPTEKKAKVDSHYFFMKASKTPKRS